MTGPRLLLGLASLALLASPAAARETVLLVNPRAEGPGAKALASDLGFQINRLLGEHPHYFRQGEAGLDPEETVTSFDCSRLDTLCAARAGQAAQADLVLLARLSRAPGLLSLQISLVDVRGASTKVSLRREIRAAGDQPLADEALFGVMRWVAARFLAARPPPPDGAGIFVHAAESDQPQLAIDGAERPANELFEAPVGAHEVVVRRRAGVESYVVDLGRGEIRVLDLTRLRSAAAQPVAPPEGEDEGDGSSAQRVMAWIALGVGVAAIGGAAVTGVMLQSEQQSFNRDCGPDEPPCPDERAADGRSLATAANGFLIGGAVALTVSTALFVVEF